MDIGINIYCDRIGFNWQEFCICIKSAILALFYANL